ncbi:MAG: LamG domain-containing protein [Candidatus Dadabacteria bacterium]
MRKLKVRNLWIEKDTNKHVDVTSYLKGLGNKSMTISPTDGDGVGLTIDSADTDDPGLKVTSESGTAIEVDGYISGAQNTIDALSTGPSLYFDGVASDLTLADNASLDSAVDEDFSVEVRFKPQDITRVTDYLINKEAGGIGWGVYLNADDIYLRFDDNTADSSAIVATAVLENDTWCHVIISVNRATGVATTYVNGVSQGTIAVDRTAATLANAGALNIGNTTADASEFLGEINLVRFWNTTITAGEALSLSNGDPVPFKYAGASNATQFAQAKDSTFADGGTNWENGDLGTTFDETTDLTCVATATGQYCKIPMSTLKYTKMPLGKRYRLRYKYTNTTAGFEFKLKGTATQTLGDAVAGTIERIEFTTNELYSSAEWLGIYSKTAAAASGSFDDIYLTRLGCVFELLPQGISGSLWEDSSGNDLDCTNNASTKNLALMTPYYLEANRFSITTGNSGDINTTGTLGHSMQAAGGELSTCGYVPFECYGGIDINKDLYAQVIWCCIDGTTSQGVTWKVTYDADAIEAGVLTAPATALDTVIVEDNEHETPYVIQKTAKGVINAGTLTDGNPIAWRVEADIVDTATDPGCWFIGLLLSQ